MTPAPATLEGGWGGFQAVETATTDLTNILDTVEVPIIAVRHDVVVAGFNKAAASVLDLSLSDIGRALHNVLLISDSPRLEQRCSDVISGGPECRVDIRDGHKWFVVRITPYATGARHVVGAVLTFTDVTAFRASTGQAIYERECTKAILNTVADPLVVLSADQRIQSGNRAFYAMFGVSREDTHGASLYEIGGGALHLTPLREQLRKLLSGRHQFQPLEVDRVPTANGQRTLVLHAHRLSFPDHAERRLLVTFQDITTRKQAEMAKDLRTEEELRRSEAFLAEGQRLSLTGTFSWRVERDEVTWSEQLYRIYGFPIGVPVTFEMLRSRVHPEDRTLLETMVQQARAGTKDFEWQYRLLMPDRSIRYLHAVAHATRDQAGQLEYIAAVQDITARRLSEEAFAKARSELGKVARAASLGVLTASIAHEVNQPLSGIITNAGTCLRMLDNEPPNLQGARETARRTLRDGNRASEVITRLRALFSNEEFTLELLHLNDVTQEVIALLLSDLQRNRIAVQSELAGGLPTIIGDRIQLQQVILNLLRNASDAMIDVHDRPRQLLIRTEPEGSDRVRLSVRDAGVGVDPQNVNKLLEAFYTTKRDGMGIGLCISHSIIERHHGRLWAEPNDGPGATFAFSIPTDPNNAFDAPR